MDPISEREFNELSNYELQILCEDLNYETFDDLYEIEEVAAYIGGYLEDDWTGLDSEDLMNFLRRIDIQPSDSGYYERDNNDYTFRPVNEELWNAIKDGVKEHLSQDGILIRDLTDEGADDEEYETSISLEDMLKGE